MIEIIGRFHPLIVHLPIGSLLLAAIFQFLYGMKKMSSQEGIGVALFVGMASASLACITGYILSADHEPSTTMTYHRWLGFITFAVSALVWLAFRFQKKYTAYLVYFLVLLVAITGHYGGSLTHGDDYLLPKKITTQKKAITDINNALVYEDIIAPILADKCYQCHSSQRQKGKLRLDDFAHIQKGGEHGKTLLANQALNSLIVKRMLLPLHDDKHMPPKSKPQPTTDDLTLIQWWINNGAKAAIKTSECIQDDKIKSILANLTTSKKQANVLPEIAAIPDPQAIKFLNDRSVSLQPLSTNSKLYLVNFIAHDSINAEDMTALDKIKDHIYILKLGHCHFDPKILGTIASYTNLHALYLENTGITDETCLHLHKLPSLHYLNVIGNKLTFNGIKSLCGIKTLKDLFVFQNEVSKGEIEELGKEYLGVRIVGEWGR